MAYTKNTWETGDIVSSAKLNHMEDGIADAGGVMVINVTDNAFDKTWQEIHDAMDQGKMCVVRKDLGGGITHSIVDSVMELGEKHTVGVGENTYSVTSATGYPEFGIK